MRGFINIISITLFVFVISLFISNRVFAQDFTNPWQNAGFLPDGLASHTVVTYNRFVYVLAGSSRIDGTEVFRGTVNNNGVISSWVKISDLPRALFWHNSVIYNNRIYVLGGAYNQGHSFSKEVYSASINNDGSLSSWQTLTPLPYPKWLGGVTIVGNKIYYSGGLTLTDVNDPAREIYWTQINHDGTIGNWNLAGIMPKYLNTHGLLEYNGKLIVLGGEGSSNDAESPPDPDGQYKRNVFVGTLQANGNISSWIENPPIPEARYRGSYTIIEKTLYSIGGYNGASSSDKVYFAELNDDGTFNKWQLSSNKLPTPTHTSPLIRIGGHIYLLGGFRSPFNIFINRLNLSNDLGVPLLMQSDPMWGTHEYDTASKWAPTEPTIGRWGCAMTSAAMVFQFHNITKLPDGQSLDPGTLNTWLKSQSDGFIRNGLVNWLSLSRLSKLAKPQNPQFSKDALEYRRSNGNNHEQLKEDLENNIPGILEVPGHFIVAKGESNDSFNINDPFYDRTTLNDYGNTFKSLGRYVPSNTDLSYIMLVVDKDVDVTIKNQQGIVVGESFLQQPISEADGSLQSGDEVKIVYVPAPASGNYTADFTSGSFKKFTLDYYLYDVNGEVLADSKDMVSGPSGSQFLISFNKDVITLSSSKRVITFETLENDLVSLHDLKEIDKGIFISMSSRAKNAHKLFNEGKAGVKGVLHSLKSQLEAQKEKGLTTFAYELLNEDISFLSQGLE